MSPEFALKVALLLEWDPAYVVACVEHERAQHADPLEQTGEILATWERIAEHFRPKHVAGILLVCAAAIFGGIPERAEALTPQLQPNINLPLYTLCALGAWRV